MSQAAQNKTETPTVSVETARAIEQTLYREARMLDQERYSEWVAMLADDLHYHMPGIENRYRRDKTDQVGDLTRMAYYNDNLEDIKMRLRRLETGTAWSEDPATRYCHMISNIEVEATGKSNEYRVYSNFCAYRIRNEGEQNTLYGHRDDIWRETPGGFKLAKRLIILKQNVLLSKNLNIYL